jgi:hypothetical protein
VPERFCCAYLRKILIMGMDLGVEHYCRLKIIRLRTLGMVQRSERMFTSVKGWRLPIVTG